MKKLIAVVTLLFAFTISANAQDKKASIEELAKKDVAALIEKVTISGSFKKDMYTLMVMKHEKLSNASLTPLQREDISKRIAGKILSGLDESQRKQLDADPELLKKITH